MKETYPIGAVLGYIEARAEDAARFAEQAPPEPQGEVAAEIPGRNEEKPKSGNGAHFQIDESAVRTSRVSTQDAAASGGLPVPAAAKGAGFLSPRVRARMAELQLTNADLAGIAGTGSANRVTIKDLENYLRQIESQTASDASAIRTVLLGVAAAHPGIDRDGPPPRVDLIRVDERGALVRLTATCVNPAAADELAQAAMARASERLYGIAW